MKPGAQKFRHAVPGTRRCSALMSVEENVAFHSPGTPDPDSDIGRWITSAGKRARGGASAAAELRQIAVDQLDKHGPTRRCWGCTRFPAELSGGQRTMRVGLARALVVNHADPLAHDEPTATDARPG